eukprot:15406-Heterococcus_DN1.PRE.3
MDAGGATTADAIAESSSGCNTGYSEQSLSAVYTLVHEAAMARSLSHTALLPRHDASSSRYDTQ